MFCGPTYAHHRTETMKSNWETFVLDQLLASMYSNGAVYNGNIEKSVPTQFQVNARYSICSVRVTILAGLWQFWCKTQAHLYSGLIQIILFTALPWHWCWIFSSWSPVHGVSGAVPRHELSLSQQYLFSPHIKYQLLTSLYSEHCTSSKYANYPVKYFYKTSATSIAAISDTVTIAATRQVHILAPGELPV